MDLGLCLGRAIGTSGKVFARAFDRETLFIQQALDFKNHLNILAPVQAMAGGALGGLQAGEFRFPIAEDVGLGLGKLADFPDAEIKFVRNGHSERQARILPTAVRLATFEHHF